MHGQKVLKARAARLPYKLINDILITDVLGKLEHIEQIDCTFASKTLCFVRQIWYNYAG